jgi:hypothetical protein
MSWCSWRWNGAGLETPIIENAGFPSGVACQFCGELSKSDDCQGNYDASLPVAYRLFLAKDLSGRKTAFIAREGGDYDARLQAPWRHDTIRNPRREERPRHHQPQYEQMNSFVP